MGRSEAAIVAEGSATRTAVLLVLVCLLFYNANLRETSSGDTAGTRMLPAVIVLEHRLYLDTFFRGTLPPEALPYWARRVGDHYVSLYPILPALLAVPIYYVPVRVWGVPSWNLLNALAKLSGTLFAALSVLFVYLGLRRLTPDPTALWITLVYAFGTSTWSVASQGLWGHGPAQLFLALAVYLALRGEPGGWALAGVGLASALMVASRPGTALLAAALLAHVVFRDRRQGVGAVLVFVAAILPILLHNLWSFGSVFGGYAELHATHPAHHGVGGPLSPSLGYGLLGLLVSPSRGLLVYSPVLVFAFAGLLLSVRDRRPVFRFLAAGLAASLLMLSAYSVWWGGHSFGPRLVTDFLPVLVLFLVPVAGRIDAARPLRAALVCLFALSVGVQVIGAFYHPSPWRVDWNTSPRDVDQAHERLWDWKDTQIVRLLRNGPRPFGFGVSR